MVLGEAVKLDPDEFQPTEHSNKSLQSWVAIFCASFINFVPFPGIGDTLVEGNLVLRSWHFKKKQPLPYATSLREKRKGKGVKGQKWMTTYE